MYVYVCVCFVFVKKKPLALHIKPHPPLFLPSQTYVLTYTQARPTCARPTTYVFHYLVSLTLRTKVHTDPLVSWAGVRVRTLSAAAYTPL